MASITSANSIYMLAVRNLFAVPQQLQGYATDAAFETDASEPAEVMIGVDGHISAGFVPFLTRQTIHLQADSASVVIFEDWLAAQKTAQEIYFGDALIHLPSLSRSYVLTSGVLTSVVPIPGTRKVLQPRSFIITWGDIAPQPI